MQSVAGVGLDPVSGGTPGFRRSCDHGRDPGRVQVPGQTETGRSGLVNHVHGSGQGTDPVQVIRPVRCELSVEDFPCFGVLRAAGSGAGMDIQTDTCTLYIAGTSQTSNVALQVGQVWQITHVLALKSGGSSPP